jgi:hypothetical protein
MIVRPIAMAFTSGNREMLKYWSLSDRSKIRRFIWKTFLLPSIDFILLNGDVGESRLEKMDQHIRPSIDEA